MPEHWAWHSVRTLRLTGFGVNPLCRFIPVSLYNIHFSWPRSKGNRLLVEAGDQEFKVILSYIIKGQPGLHEGEQNPIMTYYYIN